MGIFEDFLVGCGNDCANARGAEPEPYFIRKCHDCGGETTGANLWCDECHEKPVRHGVCMRCLGLTEDADVNECRDCYERRERREARNDAGVD